MMNEKPNIAISMGDPAGISPEIIIQSLEIAVQKSRPVIFGHWHTFESIFNKTRSAPPIDIIDTVTPAKEGRISFYNCGDAGGPINEPGERCARAQHEALEKAVDTVLGDEFDAIVTAPVAKQQIATVLPDFSGHTEYLARRAGLARDDITMVFAAKHLIVGLISTHIALKDAANAMTLARLIRTHDHLVTMLSSLHPGKRPRIAVAALNPHAGEGGLFGSEERDVIAPFCNTLTGKGRSNVIGPLSADAVYRDAISGEYDGVIAAYHDQAMIPLKLAGLGQMVNVTMGLPFIRTSPDHGVAYDIARKGRADATGFQLALYMAVELLSTKQNTLNAKNACIRLA